MSGGDRLLGVGVGQMSRRYGQKSAVWVEGGRYLATGHAPTLSSEQHAALHNAAQRGLHEITEAGERWRHAKAASVTN